jgi:hypothetical protein
MEYTTVQDNDLLGFDLEGSNEYNNQTSGFINSEIVDHLNDCQQLQKDSST